MITPEQLAFRKGKIGASDVSAALGVSPWKSKAALFHEIKGNITPPELGEKGIIGNEIEPVVLAAYTRATGIKTEPEPNTLIHPDYPWMIVHLDAKAPDYQMIQEVKNVGWTMAHQWGMDGDPDGAPMDVMFQCIQQANLAGVERVDVVAFLGGNELRIFPLEISQKAKDGVLEGLVAFWDTYIIPNKQPEVTEKDIELLKQLYWNVTNETIMYVESTATALGFQDYRKVKAQIKELEKKSNLYKAKIIEVMGNHGILMRGEDMEFTYKKTKDGTKVDWHEAATEFMDQLVRINPENATHCIEIIKQNTTTKPGHRMFLDKGK